jgi:hypothetical protein
MHKLRNRSVVWRALPALPIALSLLGAPAARAGVLFDSSGVYPVSSAMGAVVVSGDFNRDGKPDLASAARYDVNAPVSVLLGNGDGTFEKTTTGVAGGLSIATGDLDGDGRLDLAVAGFTSIATVFFGNGDGTFDPPVRVGASSGGAPGATWSIAIGQLGGAGAGLDIAATNADGLQVLFGKGDGTFAAPATYPAAGAAELVVGDFTEDGHDDIALTRATGATTGAIDVLPGSASGTLGAPIATSVDEALSSPVVTDDDGDGLLDIVAVNRAMFSSGVTLYYGTGEGTFESPLKADLETSPTTLGVGDFDKDGKPDIAAETFAGDLIAWLATGVFAESAYTQQLGDGSVGMVVADLNGDRADDVVTATYTGKVIVSRNAPGVLANPASLAFASQAVGAAAAAQAVTVTNTGIPDLALRSVSVEGAAAGDFSVGGSCQGAVLAAGAACSIVTGFLPRSGGARAATLVISGNQAGGPTRLALTGTGTATATQPSPARDTHPPKLTLSVGRTRLATVLRRGLTLSIACSEACSFKAAGTIDARTARRLRLSRASRPFTVGRGQGTAAAGRSATVRLRLNRKTVRALRNQRAIVVTVTLTAVDGAGNQATAQRKVRLHR